MREKPARAALLWEFAGQRSAGGVHVVQLGHAATELLRGGKAGGQEQVDQLLGDGGADDLRAQRDNLHVVVLDALVGGVQIVADRGTDAAHLVAGDGGAHARAAEHDAALGFAREDGGRDLARHVGEVHGSGVVGAAVDQGMALTAQRVQQLNFERIAGVVGADGKNHGELPPLTEFVDKKEFDGGICISLCAGNCGIL